MKISAFIGYGKNMYNSHIKKTSPKSLNITSFIYGKYFYMESLIFTVDLCRGYKFGI